METFYYGDPRNEIDKSQKKISRLWSLIITLLVMSFCTIIIYFLIVNRTSKLTKGLVTIENKVDTTNGVLVSNSVILSNIETNQNETNHKIDSLMSDISTVLNFSGKGSKTMNRIEKKADTLILLINK